MNQNVLRAALILISISFVLISCQEASLTSSGSFGAGSEVQVVLPPDTVSDTDRTVGSVFAFETLYSLGLALQIEPFQADQDGDVILIPTDKLNTSFIVTIEDLEARELFRARADAEGRVDTELHIPSSVDSVLLKIEADGFEARSIVIEDLAGLSMIDRTVSILENRDPVNLSMSLEGSGGGDDDGDGVPNDFDAFPDDPERAFVASVPTEGSITVAYEDLFGRARAGDADYNDFIVSYKLKIITNQDNLITDIEFNDITLVQKLAGYSHRFGFRIDSFGDIASINGYALDSSGALTKITPSKVKAPAEITVFERSSAELIGATTSFSVSFAQPQSMVNTKGAKTLLSPPPFNPYIVVLNTGHDIHLVDAEPLQNSINPLDDFRDDEGFPWALLIPADWEHPAESQRIEEVYSRFTSWRESWGEADEDWYLGEQAVNLPPYPVISGDPAVDPSVRELTISLPPGTSYQLAIDKDTAGNSDPNGDAVIFDTTLQPNSFITFDPETGLLTNVFFNTSSYRIEFWSRERDTVEQLDSRDNPLVLILKTAGGS